MALLKVLLLLGLGVSVKSDDSLQKRIIGGHDCDDKEHLYYVRLEGNNGTHIKLCGGALIHAKWILTAAYCWNSEPGWTYIAKIGVHPRTDKENDQIIRHNPVIYVNQWHEQHDIMLVKLQRSVKTIQPAYLPRCGNYPIGGTIVQLVGEGATTTGPDNQQIPIAPIPAHLQCVNMKIVAMFQYQPTLEYMFCAKAPKKDLGFGDSGGAVMFNKKIYGVISGVRRKHAGNRLIFIMNVCKYMEWISETIGLK